jgi:hypothetical protein
VSIESSAAITYETAPAASRALKRAESGVLIDATDAETPLHARETVAFGVGAEFMDRHRMKLFEDCGAADTEA